MSPNFVPIDEAIWRIIAEMPPPKFRKGSEKTASVAATRPDPAVGREGFRGGDP